MVTGSRAPIARQRVATRSPFSVGRPAAKRPRPSPTARPPRRAPEPRHWVGPVKRAKEPGGSRHMRVTVPGAGRHEKAVTYRRRLWDDLGAHHEAVRGPPHGAAPL